MASGESKAPLASEESPPKGLFLTDLVDNLFGSRWRTVVSTYPDALTNAEPWVAPQLLDPKVVTQIRQQFHAGDRVKHVCLGLGLELEQAMRLHAALDDAVFVRHHFAPYPLDVAPREQQPDSPLAAFFDWLSSREAAIYHSWLVGWLRPLPPKLEIQVQLSRMHVGDAFPMHMDTEKEGIAAVYQLTHPWEQEWGGVLSFHHPVTKQAELVIPPTFGSLMLFRPQHAPHQVTPVLPAAGEHCRYTMTAFYLAE